TGRLRYAFRLCLGREPSATELEKLNAGLLAKLRAHYAANPAEAAKVLAGGGPAGKKLTELAGAPAADKAAWVMVARALLNLDEFITRERAGEPGASSATGVLSLLRSLTLPARSANKDP